MTTRTLRRFNRKGLEAFEQCLRGMTAGRLENHLPLLESEDLTEPAGDGIVFEVRDFKDRREAAEYLDCIVKQLGKTDHEIREDVALWTWLSAVWLDLLYPDRKKLLTGDPIPRLVLKSSETMRFYRHFLAGPWSIYSAHREKPDKAMALLCTSVTSPGEVAEQFGANSKIIRRKTTVEAITKLYINPGTGTLKQGSSSKDAGGARRLVKVLKQFDLTYYREDMDADEIISLLPDEFDRFR
jgi:hypothetical protein